MNRTAIEYGDLHWSVVTGCSFGCPWCWARKVAVRYPMTHDVFSAQDHYMGGRDIEAVPFSTPVCHHDRLDEPLRRKKPARILVSFMGDLFGMENEINPQFVKDVFHVMEQCPQHTFFLLTKRAHIMRYKALDNLPSGDMAHVWYGVSITNQADADERVPLLLQTPAAHRWVSIEPMLGPVKLRYAWHSFGDPRLEGIDWVVVGGMGKPLHRRYPCKREWVESIREQCREAGVPLWEKFSLRETGIVTDRPLVQERP